MKRFRQRTSLGMELCFMEPSRKPLNLLLKSLNREVCVRLKNDVEYCGRMVECDGYMNLVLDEASR